MLIRPVLNLAVCDAATGQYEDAELHFGRARAIAETLGPQHPYLGLVLANYAHFLRATKRRPEAKVLEARSNSILSAYRLGTSHTVNARDLAAFSHSQK